MANRYGLGAADFVMTANNEQMLRAFAQSEAAARQSSAKIGAAIKDAENSTKGLGAAFVGVSGSTLGYAAALAGVTIGLQTVSAASKQTLADTLKLKQVQFEFTQTFKGTSAELTKFAEQLGNATNKTTGQVQAAITSFGTLQNNYALTSAEIKELTNLTANYAAKTGREMVDVSNRIQAGIRGEGEAVEILGQTLGRDFVKNMGLMNEAQRKHFFTLSDVERAELILAEARRQGLTVATAVADRANSDLAIYDKWNKSVLELSQNIGEKLNQALQVVLPNMIKVTDAMAKLIGDSARQQKAIAIFTQFNILLVKHAGNWTLATAELGKYIKQLDALEAAQAALRDPFPGEAGFIGPTEQEARDNEAEQEKAARKFETQLRQALEAQKKANKERNENIQAALNVEIEMENERYRNVVNKTRFAKEAATQAAEDRKDAALAAIKEEQDAENEAHDAKMNQLRAERDERLDTLSDNRDNAVRALEVEKEAVVDAVEEQIRQQEIARDKRKELAEDTRDNALEAIDAEKDAVVDAIETQIAQQQRAKDVAMQAADDTRDNALEAIEEEETRRERYFQSRQQQAEDTKEKELQAAEDVKEGSIKAIEEEERKRERARVQEDRRIEERLRQIDRQRELEDRALDATAGNTDRRRELEDQALDDREEAELRALERRQDNEQKELQANKDNISRVYEEQLRLIEQNYDEQVEAARDANDAIVEDIEDRQEALQDEHRNRLRQLEEQEQAALDAIQTERDAQLTAIQQERDSRLRQIQDEKRARLDEFDSRIRAVNELQRAFNNENKITDLTQSLTIAQRKGDITEVKRIEEEIRRERIRQSYETAEQILQVEKDAVNNELSLLEDQISDELELREKAIKAEYELREKAIKEQADILKLAIDDEVLARKRALDDEKEAAKKSLDDQLDLLKAHNEQQKLELELNRDAQIAALEARTAAVRTNFDAEKLAIKDRYEAYARAINDQRYAEDLAFEARKVQIDDQRAREDAEHGRQMDLLQDRRGQEDEAFDRRKDRINEAYERERDQVNQTYERTIEALKDRETQEKDNFDRRKKVVADTYDDEKRRLQELYDDPVDGILARLRDSKEAAIREYGERSKTVRQSYEDEQRLIKATYDDELTGSIPALERAVKAAKTNYEERTRVVEENFKKEQDAIKTLYDHPVDGLLAKQEEAHKNAEKNYSARTATVQAAYDAEKRNIYETYDGPNGLIHRNEEAHNRIRTAIDQQRVWWNTWERDLTRNFESVMNGPLRDFINRINELEQRGLIAPGFRPPSGGGSDGGGGPGRPGGGQGGQFNTLFPYNAPYNGPYGGAMWPGGPTRHRGIDLTLPGANSGRGTPLGAFTEAVVVNTTNESAGGRGIITRQVQTGLHEYYGHLDNVAVKAGQHLTRGELIGTLGASGLEPWNTPHLHYEVRRNPGGDPVGSTIDPVPYMGGFNNPLGGGSTTGTGELIELRPFGPNGPVIVIRAVAQDWETKARQIAHEEGFSDPSLFARQMRQESGNFDPDVIAVRRTSSAGAKGIAQFMDATARALGVNVYDPIDSLKKAARYMHYLEQRYNGLHGNPGVRNALWAYNAGEGSLQQGFLPGETRKYLQIIQGYANGKNIVEPTLMVGLRTGEMGIAGETGQPERLLGTTATANYDNNMNGAMQSIQIPILIGNEQIQNIMIYGLKLMATTGRNVGVPGLQVQ